MEPIVVEERAHLCVTFKHAQDCSLWCLDHHRQPQGFILQQIVAGPASISTLGGLVGFRLDAISATMTSLVAFIGWIVVRYSRFYLDGEAREGAFHGWMLAALGAVLLLVQAGSLPVLVVAFLAIGAALRQLLRFYAERAEARRAAAKFTLVWALGDATLVLATLLLAQAYGTVDIAAVSAAVTAIRDYSDWPEVDWLVWSEHIVALAADDTLVLFREGSDRLFTMTWNDILDDEE